MLNASTVAIANLTSADKSEMYALFEHYYSSVNRDNFNKDLCEKDYVLMLKLSNGVIKGFTTLKIMPFSTDNITGRALFSGDTIIHHEYWGNQVLPKAWCRLAGMLKAQVPDLPLYWFLIVKGHRTYRYLSIFTYHYFPNHKTETSTQIQSIMDCLAYQKFGDAYNSEKGLIQFASSRGQLKKEWASVPDRLANHPEVKFFLNRNPGYRQGDELVCITELCEKNMRFHARRAFLAGLEQADTLPIIPAKTSLLSC